MANITQYLQRLMNAVYGEEVRGSIRDALLSIDNDVTGLSIKHDALEERVEELEKPVVEALVAEKVAYDNASSGLTGENVQAAIDEIDAKADMNASGIASLNSSLTVTEEYLRFTYENKTVNIYFRKYGKMITVLMAKENESMALPTSWTPVGNLTNIKPPSDRYIPFVSSNGYTGVIRIYPDGGVRILGHSSNQMWLQCSATTIL